MSTSARRPVLRLALASAALAVGLFGVVTTHSSASDNGAIGVTLRDRCDPATFNVFVRPGTCVGTGDVEFLDFVPFLNPTDFGHPKWRTSPDKAGAKVGQVLHVQNRGGEVHSFTEVSNFGPGFVDQLNGVFAPNTPPATPVAAFVPLPPGAIQDITLTTKGTHLFMCMIHPWMRSVITVGG